MLLDWSRFLSVGLAISAIGSVACTGCVRVAPPASPLPNAAAAIQRMRATSTCGTGLQANAKIDHVGAQGRVRGDLMLIASVPAKIRMDVISPFGVALATLTSDGERFAMADLREKRLFVGAPTACNIARLTTVPIPAHVLVDLLRGRGPVIRNDPDRAQLEWNSNGYYVLSLRGPNGTSETLHIAPHPEDMGRTWNDQRLRVLDVVVQQGDLVVYHAELDEYASAAMAGPRVDEAGIDPPIPPSGPECHAEIPRRIHVEVPARDEDVRFRYENVTWNPPLADGVFTLQAAPGMVTTPVRCE